MISFGRFLASPVSSSSVFHGCWSWTTSTQGSATKRASGMKSAVNGGLQLSVLDGWWAEAYEGAGGWALPGDVDPDSQAQDERDANALHRIMDDHVLPTFYDRDEHGLPLLWLARIRTSLRSLGPRFCATRMLRQYATERYPET